MFPRRNARHGSNVAMVSNGARIPARLHAPPIFRAVWTPGQRRLMRCKGRPGSQTQRQRQRQRQRSDR